jgi:hypothetical protein
MADRSHWPNWVSLGLWGISSYAGAVAFAVVAFIAAGGCGYYAFAHDDPRFYAGIGLIAAAGWYPSAAHWVQEHSDWS